jgi:hypothetical protein
MMYTDSGFNERTFDLKEPRQLANVEELRSLLRNRENSPSGCYRLPPDVKLPERYERKDSLYDGVFIDNDKNAFLYPTMSLKYVPRIRYGNCPLYTDEAPSLKKIPTGTKDPEEMRRLFNLGDRINAWLFTLEDNEIHIYHLSPYKAGKKVLWVQFSSDKDKLNDVPLAFLLNCETGKISSYCGYGNELDLSLMSKADLAVRNEPANIFSYSAIKSRGPEAASPADLKGLPEGEARGANALMGGWNVYPHSAVLKHGGWEYLIQGRNWLPDDQPIYFDQRYVRINYDLEERLSALKETARRKYGGKLGYQDLIKELGIPLTVSADLNHSEFERFKIRMFSYDDSVFTTYLLDPLQESRSLYPFIPFLRDKHRFAIVHSLSLTKNVFYKTDSGEIMIKPSYKNFNLTGR